MTPSDTVGRTWTASFADGQSARGWPCRVRLGERGLLINRGEGHDELIWPYGALLTPHPISKGEDEALVTYSHMPGAQLYVKDSEFVAALARRAPALTTMAQRWRWARPLIGLAALIGAVVGVVWFLELRPARTIAGVLPVQSRQTVGQNVINSFVSKHKVCNAPAGRAALDKLVDRLLRGSERPNYFRLTVVDWSLINAFAAPGGQMMLTSGVIRAARTPEEVAGVLAHEIGHGIELHPETGLVRAVGLSALVELLTGGSSGTLSNVGAILVQTSYVRQDERAADQQALRLLKEAGISQNGLAEFFERLGTKSTSTSGKNRAGSFGAFDLLRTHPFPAERAQLVRQAQPYPTTPALTRAEWRALKAICSG